MKATLANLAVPIPRLILVGLLSALMACASFVFAPQSRADTGASWCPGVPIPTAPTKLPLSLDPDGSVRFSWTAVPDATQYAFNVGWYVKGSSERVHPTGRDPVFLGPSTTSISVKPVDGAYAALAQVSARTKCGDTAWTDALWADVPITPPAAPIANVNVTESAIRVMVYRTATNGEFTYRVRLLPDNRVCETPSAVGYGSAECLFSNLPLGHEYTVSITGVNGIGTGPATTYGPYVIARGPNPPRSPVVKSLSSSSARITWSRPLASSAARYGGDVQGYRVISSPGGFMCETTRQSCTVKGLSPGTAYRFKVVAENAAYASKPVVTKPARTKFAPPQPSLAPSSTVMDPLKPLAMLS